MARLHLIWDADDKLSVPGQDACDAMNIKCALMPIAEDTSYTNAKDVIEDMAMTMLDQLGILRDN